MSTVDSVTKWVKEHKLKSVGGLWLTGLVGSAAYQWTQNTPTSLKIIHSRVYAQALTLAALGMAGVVEAYEHSKRQGDELSQMTERLTTLERQQLERAHASGHTHKT